MSRQSNPVNHSNNEVANAIADDSVKLFRAGLFMITIYAGLLSVVLGSADSVLGVYIRDSAFTRYGFVLWIGAMIFSVITYWASRRFSCAENTDDFVFFKDTQDLSDYSTGTLISYLIATLLLVFGLLDAYIKYNSDTPTQTGLELDTVAVLLGLAFAFGFVIGGSVFFIRKGRSLLSDIS